MEPDDEKVSPVFNFDEYCKANAIKWQHDSFSSTSNTVTATISVITPDKTYRFQKSAGTSQEATKKCQEEAYKITSVARKYENQVYNDLKAICKRYQLIWEVTYSQSDSIFNGVINFKNNAKNFDTQTTFACISHFDIHKAAITEGLAMLREMIEDQTMLSPHEATQLLPDTPLIDVTEVIKDTPT